jgi:hypothetical protein
MTRVAIQVDLEEDTYRDLESEARREGIPVETLLATVVNRLIEDMRREEQDGTDHPIFP